eukprot:TRINITY_DN21195_c0_g1_i1.p1 TRINITY_DN21195_c0_g1~~TRINITY_DN21195_c0_g1_i1.p1  ORF type:complete len:200 (+),score=41.47 TRINITY_DN21195_c0_g1_i1:261-860(+)
MSPLGGTTTTTTSVQSCGGRLRDLRQRSGLTGMEVTEGTRLTTAELLGLEAANTNSAYEKWGSLLGRFCLLTMTSAFSLMSSACVNSLLEGGNDDGSGSECSEDDNSDREAAFKYSVEDIGDIMAPPPPSSQQPFSATTANHNQTAKGGGGGGTVSYTHLRAHETPEHLVCRLLLEKKKKKKKHQFDISKLQKDDKLIY